MTVLEASERLARDVEGHGHFTVSLLLQMQPAEFLDRHPPPDEGFLLRLQRWLRRCYPTRQARGPGCHCCLVRGVMLDEVDGEFLLWLDQPPEPSLTSAQTVTVGELHHVLAAHCPNQGHYLEAVVYWRGANPRRQIRLVRLDWPVLGFGGR